MKYVTRITAFARSLLRPAPARDWGITLTLAGILAAVMLGLALYFYMGLQSGAIIAPQPTEAPPAPALSRADLSRLLEEYQTRALNYQSRNIPAPRPGNVE